MSDYEIIFFKPRKFEDCMKCIEYIRDEKIVHINLGELDGETSQRILDFISGAVFIQEGEVVNPGENVFCSIPKNKKYLMDYKGKPGSSTSSRYDEEEEIIPKYGIR
ncbi:MAG: cell division protein SepF [Cetobacterium sp.]|uniref:Cell division inhibitor SepF n=1 Tax=Cetobacterium ceti TaxID=180163 RepID=A0A1T4K2E6_9FUSO|nr:cell division protein SepF [Cetobacterium ceti]MCJ8341898.1 cell division protein SepF [Cetobacterium sp.]SJZ36523.1 cell division inhibitor SepF [Cetobacterium ceti]